MRVISGLVGSKEEKDRLGEKDVEKDEKDEKDYLDEKFSGRTVLVDRWEGCNG